MHQIHSVSLQSVLSKTQELSKIGFWREMLWDWSKIFFNCSSSLEISVESLELGLCKVLSKLTSEIRETTLVTILWMRLSLRVARARAEQWGRPRHHSTSIPLVTPSSPKPPPLLFLFSEVVSSVLRGCSFCCCEKKVLSPPKRGQLSLFGCLHFPLLLALVLGPAAISNIFLLSITGPTSGLGVRLLCDSRLAATIIMLWKLYWKCQNISFAFWCQNSQSSRCE